MSGPLTALDWTVLAAYFVAGTVAFALMGLDKWKARKKAYRIPENTLLLWSVCFGAMGGYLGMHLFRHKTQHPKFAIALPALMLVQLCLLAVYFVYLRQA